jgi:hypothetical protein
MDSDRVTVVKLRESTALCASLAARTLLVGAAVTLQCCAFVRVASAQTPPMLSTRVSPAIGPETITAPSARRESAWSFIENSGQWDSLISFAAIHGGATLRLQRDGAVLRLANKIDQDHARGIVLRLGFDGSSQEGDFTGQGQLPGARNFLLGNEPTRWRSGVPAYTDVVQHDVYPGVDVHWGSRNNRLEFDVVVAAGVDLGQVSMHWEGADDVQSTPDGSLLLHTQYGDIHQLAPLAWEVGADGTRRTLPCTCCPLGAGCFTFEAPGRSPDSMLTIDPGLEWSTLLGGGGVDEATSVALGQDGAVTVGGQTGSVDFPVTLGAFDTTHSVGGGKFVDDVFVTRIDPTGSSLVFSTFLGGSANDFANQVAVDASGQTVVAGSTGSSDYPTTPGAFDTVFTIGDGFVTRLDSTGSALVYSTLIGGSKGADLEGMALDATGVVTVTGSTVSVDFPVTAGAYDTTYGGGVSEDVFVAKLSADGSSLLNATYLGGIGSDYGEGIAVDVDGSVLVAGFTSSSDFPVTTSFGKGSFVARLDPTLGRLISSTTFGGGVSLNQALAVAAAPGGAIVTGRTDDSNFPTTPGAFDTTFSGGIDAFVLQVNTTGTALVYSTFLGGGNTAEGHAIAVDSAGVATVLGYSAQGYPTTLGAYDPVNDGSSFDLVVTRLNPDGSALWYSTFLGGSKIEGGTDPHLWGIALGPEGEAVVVSQTRSTDYPTTSGAFDTTASALSDACVTKLDMLPTGVSKYGVSTPGCKGKIAIGVTAMPKVLVPGFALTSTNGPTGGPPGLLVLGLGGLQTSIKAKGAQMWIDPALPFLMLPVTANNVGFTLVSLPIPHGVSAGLTVYAQFFWKDPCGSGGWAASNALSITTQP